ncbi:MAG: exodeoxyribonuclease large subunit, partial [Bacillota bacterium]|nr:exodeoxyribonuclease large subunit [Bacillota bacterium]
SVLERGFAVVMDAVSGVPVTRASQVQRGQRLRVRFADGTVIVRQETGEEGK